MSYTAPATFTERLRHFDPNLRVRWSNRTHTFHIESKVGRAAEIFALPHDDGAIRRRDGYQLVCEVTAGSRMWCHQQVDEQGTMCGAPLTVPMMEFREVRCAKCRKLGFDGRYVYGYFGWTERLLDHLRWIDPRNTWRDTVVSGNDRANHAADAERERDTLNALTANALEFRAAMTGLTSVYLNDAQRKGNHV